MYISRDKYAEQHDRYTTSKIGPILDTQAKRMQE